MTAKPPKPLAPGRPVIGRVEMDANLIGALQRLAELKKQLAEVERELARPEPMRSQEEAIDRAAHQLLAKNVLPDDREKAVLRQHREHRGRLRSQLPVIRRALQLAEAQVEAAHQAAGERACAGVSDWLEARARQLVDATLQLHQLARAWNDDLRWLEETVPVRSRGAGVGRYDWRPVNVPAALDGEAFRKLRDYAHGLAGLVGPVEFPD
jgi:hypothetical protein